MVSKILRLTCSLLTSSRLADRYINVRWDMEELLTKKAEIVSKDLLKLGLIRQ